MVQQKLREGEQTCDLLMLVCLRSLRQSLDLAADRKRGEATLEELCMELEAPLCKGEGKRQRKRKARQRRKSDKNASNRNSEEREESVSLQFGSMSEVSSVEGEEEVFSGKNSFGSLMAKKKLRHSSLSTEEELEIHEDNRKDSQQIEEENPKSGDKEEKVEGEVINDNGIEGGMEVRSGECEAVGEERDEEGEKEEQEERGEEVICQGPRIETVQKDCEKVSHKDSQDEDDLKHEESRIDNDLNDAGKVWMWDTTTEKDQIEIEDFNKSFMEISEGRNQLAEDADTKDEETKKTKVIKTQSREEEDKKVSEKGLDKELTGRQSSTLVSKNKEGQTTFKRQDFGIVHGHNLEQDGEEDEEIDEWTEVQKEKRRKGR